MPSIVIQTSAFSRGSFHIFRSVTQSNSYVDHQRRTQLNRLSGPRWKVGVHRTQNIAHSHQSTEPLHSPGGVTSKLPKPPWQQPHPDTRITHRWQQISITTLTDVSHATSRNNHSFDWFYICHVPQWQRNYNCSRTSCTASNSRLSITVNQL